MSDALLAKIGLAILDGGNMNQIISDVLFTGPGPSSARFTGIKFLSMALTV